MTSLGASLLSRLTLEPQAQGQAGQGRAAGPGGVVGKNRS
jgi:hypothetical protein